jgi:hypothetical protein
MACLVSPVKSALPIQQTLPTNKKWAIAHWFASPNDFFTAKPVKLEA